MEANKKSASPPMPKRIKKKRAYEEIVKQIRNLIYKGKLKRGDKLPSEQELMGTFKVSRVTVREAILSLKTMKLVEPGRGNGTFVVASSEKALVQPLAASFFHEKDKLIDIFFLRRIVEPEVAQLASQNRTPKEVIKLAQILKEQETEAADNENPARTDTQFHQILARMAKNRVLERLLLALFDKTRGTHLQSEERKQMSLQGHEDIFVAIKNGSGGDARQAMRKHLENVEAILLTGRKEAGSRHKIPLAE